MSTQPESRLVYSTDPLQRPPVIRTHFVVYSIATAAHLAALGVFIEPTVEDNGRWRAPIAAKRDALRYERSFQALKAGGERRARERAKQQAVSS